MNRFEASLVGTLVSAALVASPAMAAKARHTRTRAPAAATACCLVPAGTPIQIELVDNVSTKVQHSGDTIALKLAAPLIVGGRIVLREGTPGVGQVVEAVKPGMGGRAGKLVLAARYLTKGGEQIPLQGLQLAGSGASKANEAQAVGLTGIAFAPLGFISLAVQGGDLTFPGGSTAIAKIASDTRLPSLGAPTRHQLAVANAAATTASQANDGGMIAIPPPPTGMGQVVFFRAKSLMGTGQWFNVREDKAALGKLANGAYFIQVTQPGVHTYTDTLEPELKDKLKLEVDPNETYYVEGSLTKGVVVSAAYLSPSDRAAFDKASKDLKLAPPPGEDKDQADSAAASSNAADSSAATSEMNSSTPPSPPPAR
jgi:hypothetical protein